MNTKTERRIILAVGILANMCQGAAYASSVFARPFIEHLGLVAPGTGGTPMPDMAKWALLFSINLACLPLGMLISGKIADAGRPRLVVALGGVMFGIGMLATGFSNSLTWALLSFGIMMGIGSGAAYGVIVATSVQWFPDKRGLAGGLSVGALGLGTLLIAPLARWLMESAPETQTPVLWAFKILGLIFFVTIVVASGFMRRPPTGYKPEGLRPRAGKAAATDTVDVDWKTMAGKPAFKVLFLTYACGAFSGLMIISQASPIAQQSAGLSPAEAAWIVSLVGLANALGRVFWGFVSDKTSRLGALFAMFLITAATMFLLPQLSTNKLSLLLACMTAGACFGGYLGIFPSICADYFGTRNLTVNYALLFSAFSLAAIAGPISAGKIHTLTGSYVNAFIIAGSVSSVGAILTIVAMAMRKTGKDTEPGVNPGIVEG